ncbi:Enthd1 [Phodopus roborovskii]|uniref:Enthd1 protein n=1 Tax=Phodopus roborovskii TaxID=109678 RepID=A0AAU9ZF08_PHORO|nr:Enthd1 [Phodopus roborovskii]
MKEALITCSSSETWFTSSMSDASSSSPLRGGISSATEALVLSRVGSSSSVPRLSLTILDPVSMCLEIFQTDPSQTCHFVFGGSSSHDSLCVCCSPISAVMIPHSDFTNHFTSTKAELATWSLVSAFALVCWEEINVQLLPKLSQNAVSTPSEKKPSLQTNTSLGKRLEKATTNTLTESPPQTSQEEQRAAKSFETLTPLQAFRQSGKDEFVSLGLRMSKSASVFPNQSSVETLYVSPSFKTVTPEKEPRSSKALQTPKKSRLCWMEDMEDVSLKPLAMRENNIDSHQMQKFLIFSTTSEVASSFSTLSVSSPDLVHPEKSAHHFPLVFTSPSFWIQPHPQPSSAPFTYKDEAARVHHPFAPRSTASSDDEEYPIIPDNSSSATEKPGHTPSCNQVAFSTPTRTYFPSVPQASLQTSEGLPRESPESGSIRTLLGEVRGAVLRLHEDLSLVIQELSVINSYLGNLSGSSQAPSEALEDPQSSRGSSDPI